VDWRRVCVHSRFKRRRARKRRTSLRSAVFACDRRRGRKVRSLTNNLTVTGTSRVNVLSLPGDSQSRSIWEGWRSVTEFEPEFESRRAVGRNLYFSRRCDALGAVDARSMAEVNRLRIRVLQARGPIHRRRDARVASDAKLAPRLTSKSSNKPNMKRRLYVGQVILIAAVSCVWTRAVPRDANIFERGGG